MKTILRSSIIIPFVLICSLGLAQNQKTQLTSIPQSDEEKIMRKCLGIGNQSLIKCVNLEVKRANDQILKGKAGQENIGIPVDESSIARGKVVYSQYCVQCHGVKGKADGPTAPYVGRPVSDLTTSNVQQQNNGILYKKITQDNSAMKAFGHMYSEKDLQDAIGYIRILSSKENRN